MLGETDVRISAMKENSIVSKIRHHVFRLFVVYPESSFPSALPGWPMVLLIG